MKKAILIAGLLFIGAVVSYGNGGAPLPKSCDLGCQMCPNINQCGSSLKRGHAVRSDKPVCPMSMGKNCPMMKH